jgi:hypothetical protein
MYEMTRRQRDDLSSSIALSYTGKMTGREIVSDPEVLKSWDTTNLGRAPAHEEDSTSVGENDRAMILSPQPLIR